MSKAPKYLPQKGDRVKLRGRPAVGTLRDVSERNWAGVEWDVRGSAPLVVHLYELEKLPAAGQSTDEK